MHQIHRITLDDALPLLAAGRAKAEEIGVKQTLCVVDDGGNVLALHRLPGARLTGVDISIAKAFTAAGHERATHLFNEPPNGPALPGNEAFGISHMLPGKFAIFVGGFPLVYDGQIVGGVGISGGNGEQDKAVGAAMLAEFEALTSDRGEVARNERPKSSSQSADRGELATNERSKSSSQSVVSS